VGSTWTYDTAGRLASQGSGNRIATRYAYSALGQLLGLKNIDLQGNDGAGSVLSQFGHVPNQGESFNPQQVLAYDGAMNMVRRVVDVPGQASLSSLSTYGYDEGDQLTNESSTRGDASTYSRIWNYDHAGNPISGSNTASSAGGTPATSTWARTFNESNQETTLGIDPDTGQKTRVLYQYDGNGNPTLYKGVAAAYDARDRMIAWGRMRAGYRSDGKRAWKVTLDQEGQEVSRKYFLYDGDLLLCEIDGQGRVTSTRTWGANGLVSKASTAYDAQGDASTSTTFYAFDERGSVAQRMVVLGAGVDASTSIAHASFDSWGNGSSGGDSVGFGGQWGYYTDQETGLILCTHRYYDPSSQRWATRDPIDYAGGINLYGYVTNNPTNAVDPDGLQGNGIFDLYQPPIPGDTDRNGHLSADEIYGGSGYGAGYSSAQMGGGGTGWGGGGGGGPRAPKVPKQTWRRPHPPLTSHGRRTIAKKLGGIPRANHPICQGVFRKPGDKRFTKWWEYRDWRGGRKIVIEHHDGSVHVGTVKPDSRHREGDGPPKYWQVPNSGHAGDD